MQALSAAPRGDLADEVVRELLATDDVLVDVGADLLDLQDTFVEDISGDLVSGSVTWTGAADIHRSCDLVITRELAWDRDRVRVWKEMSSPLLPGVVARFWRGVFVLTRPTKVVDDSDVLEHTVKGWDKGHLLRSPVGDTWVVEQSTRFGPELRRLLRGAGYRGTVVVDPAVEDVFIPEARVWPLDPAKATSWLRVANDIAQMCGAAPLWWDEVGTARSQPILPLAARPVEWVFDAQDRRTIVGPVRPRQQDLAAVPNRWRFTARDWPTEPVRGDGQHWPQDNVSTGPTSYAQRDRWVVATREVDAVSQDALVAVAEEEAARDRRAAGTRDLTIGPLPLLGHQDLVEVRDTGHGPEVRALVTTWTEQLSEQDGTLKVEEVA